MRLVEKSLVLSEEQADGSTGLRLLDTLRDSARERLLAAGEEAAARGRRAAFYHGLVGKGDVDEALTGEAGADRA